MITAGDLRSIPLFGDLPESELRTIASRAADVRLQAGDWLMQDGETAAFFALLAGRLALLKTVGRDEEQIGTFEPGAHFGEVSLLVGSSALASIRAMEPSRVMRLEALDFHDLIIAGTQLNARVMRTMAERVGQLQRAAIETPGQVVTIIGDRWDLACHDVRDFLARNHVPYRWVDNWENGRQARYPVVVLPDGERLESPEYRELAARVGLRTIPSRAEYDVAIVGGGAAGLGAAVYGASEGLHTLLVERLAPGGQAGTSSRIENYLGFPAGISGDDLSNRALHQARKFGADIVVARRVTALAVGAVGNGPYPHALALDGGDTVCARSIVLAMGLSWRLLDVPGARELLGRGVFYGAARTEAHSVLGQTIALVGGGNSAGQAAMLFSDFAAQVIIIVQNHALEETMSRYLIDEIRSKDNIRVETESDVAAVEGQGHVERVVVRRRGAAAEERLAVDAVFVFIGATADTRWLPASIVRDAKGYVCTGPDMIELTRGLAALQWPLERDPYFLETSVPGIFAAGDVRHASVKRVASAVGEGGMTIAFVHRVRERDGPVVAPALAPH